MNYIDAKIYEYSARVSAAVCKVAGMNVINASRLRRGETLAYDEDRFVEIEEEILGWANSIMRLAEQIHDS